MIVKASSIYIFLLIFCQSILGQTFCPAIPKFVFDNSFQNACVDYLEECYKNPDWMLKRIPGNNYENISWERLKKSHLSKVFRGLFQDDSNRPDKYHNISEDILREYGLELDSIVLEGFKPEYYIFARRLMETFEFSGALNCMGDKIDLNNCYQDFQNRIESFKIDLTLKTVEEVQEQYDRLKREGFGQLLENLMAPYSE